MTTHKRMIAGSCSVLLAAMLTPLPLTAHSEDTAHAPSKATIQEAWLKFLEAEARGETSGPDNSRTLSIRGYEIKIKDQQPGKEKPDIVASCSAVNGKCKLSQKVTISATISAGGGVTLNVLSANAGISLAQTIERSIESESPVLGARQMYVARPQGTFIMFSWKKKFIGIPTSSGDGAAFYPTGVSFRVVPR